MQADAARSAVTVREYRSGDESAVLELLAASMGWMPDDQHREYFRWKHELNPFGRSAAWVAVADDRVVGFRTFMRWEFLHEGQVRRAVRAVDTATHPDFQGQGIFSKLTRHGLAEMEREGIDFVFNTPNSKSLPGYLKMGWVEVGRVPVRMRLSASLGSLTRMVNSRTPAERWSLPTNAGVDAGTVLDDKLPVERLLAAHMATRAGSLTTNRSPEFLRWRYGEFTPLAYRCLLLTDDVTDGLIVFRLRRRGQATEAVVNDVLLPASPDQARGLMRRLLRRSRADYILRIGRGSGDGLLPVPRQGPVLTFRPFGEMATPPLHSWVLEMGDVELF